MANKTAQIIEILESNENITQREIAKKVDCTEGYVSKVKKSIGNTEVKPAERQPVESVDPNDDEFETETSSFVKKVKIVPDQKVLTDQEEEPDKDEEYECGSCGHVWTADKAESQKSCPKCGEVF